jgi:hypothetical protein
LAEESTGRLLDWIKERQNKIEEDVKELGTQLAENKTALEGLQTFASEAKPILNLLKEDLDKRTWKAWAIKVVTGALIGALTTLVSVLFYIWPIIREAIAK